MERPNREEINANIKKMTEEMKNLPKDTIIPFIGDPIRHSNHDPLSADKELGIFNKIRNKNIEDLTKNMRSNHDIDSRGFKSNQEKRIAKYNKELEDFNSGRSNHEPRLPREFQPNSANPHNLILEQNEDLGQFGHRHKTEFEGIPVKIGKLDSNGIKKVKFDFKNTNGKTYAETAGYKVPKKIDANTEILVGGDSHFPKILNDESYADHPMHKEMAKEVKKINKAEEDFSKGK
jgi:hypothetical protein